MNHNLATSPYKSDHENGGNRQSARFFSQKDARDFLAGRKWQSALSAEYCGKEKN
jgi:hypothetical protein